ncbi:hypothetical protein [Bacterioplanoides sp.]|uniref:hypothetical protein n=1 Tax=Bacterioplanoides sp. TaxID=2066072 RepID=UPI003B5A7718
MMYAIKQSYWNHQGKSWVKILEPRYKTYRGAEKTAARSYRWTCADPETREVFEASSAEVVEVGK